MHASGRSQEDYEQWRADLHASLDPRVAEARRLVAAGLSNIASLGRG